MPLNTEIIRNGEALKVWNNPNMLNYFLTVGLKEGDPDFEYQPGETYGTLEEGVFVNFNWHPIYYMDTKCPLWSKGELVLKEQHVFEDMTFEPGDKLRMWRSHK